MSCNCITTYKSATIELDSPTAPTKLVIEFTGLISMENLEIMELMTCQPIPTPIPPVPVVIKVGVTEYVANSSSGNILQSDQLKAVKACACACKPSYKAVYGDNAPHFMFMDNLLQTIV